jgi:predicted nucleotidyltransferase
VLHFYSGKPLQNLSGVDRKISSAKTSSKFDVGDDDARGLVIELLAHGFVERARGPAWGISHGSMEGPCYQVTMAGNALANARAVKRIGRRKADDLLAKFVDRVKVVNANDDLGYYVPETYVFGSYLQPDAKDFGDIDIALDLALRPIIDRDIVKHSAERAAQSGRRIVGFLERVGYSEPGVRRILKDRGAYISLHPLSDLKATNAMAQKIYQAPAEDHVPRHPRSIS